MYFHTDSGQTLNWLAGVVIEACAQGQSLRLDVTADGSLMVKRGEGQWCAPIESTPDRYRDQTQSCQRCNYLAAGKWDGAASATHTCNR